MAGKVSALARGMRWGALLYALKVVTDGLAKCSDEIDLLDVNERGFLRYCAEGLAGIQQKAWAAYDKERTAKPRRTRKAGAR
jgi:hypothetical protein